MNSNESAAAMLGCVVGIIIGMVLLLWAIDPYHLGYQKGNCDARNGTIVNGKCMHVEDLK